MSLRHELKEGALSKRSPHAGTPRSVREHDHASPAVAAVAAADFALLPDGTILRNAV